MDHNLPEILVPLLVILIGLYIGLIRNTQVYNFRRRLLEEESILVKDNLDLWRGDFIRFLALPSYYWMVLQFWVPLSHHERPLRDFYDIGALLEECSKLKYKNRSKGGKLT